ncbi:DUF938 domain-containing protein [Methylococcus capsulatus]|jgi:cyclopropane fatty-acyl-phospholipid synthase-like methyltransferase|uniref:DUF938 domain-containing protein n=2 Tax=Methylococcus capsulatus TaxID=414 RepID=Q60AF1_METCA|nr:DUF938 domain-containing protein [Methylococcus capsulatus]AAU92831.1 conserved hypothetical protein [Methylococcus capsulatus str. Bath]QXP88335.1 DUF938 domain-containing protein [Methylococcus capsulatus]QXP94657.1 DUF938 domain-containing protein [Methylococcus capsulatus]UQN13374.1 class I SAM-dependent methyltransferase [Methylococcus capsulatus]CAI8737318.1 conserved protein of unknown function [Methylococcus capsulatus]
MYSERPPLDPHPLSPYMAWTGYRNRDAILDVLKGVFPRDKSDVLEFAAGSGMHAHYFAQHFAHLTFHPSDSDEDLLPHIEERTRQSGLSNVARPRRLDLTQPETWPAGEKFHAIYCINVCQVAPVSIVGGIMACSSRILADGGFLFIYGPFLDYGRFASDFDEEFDRLLRSTGEEGWSLKDIAELDRAAGRHGMRLDDEIDMPSNDFALIYRRA